jgi:hypothetical protein
MRNGIKLRTGHARAVGAAIVLVLAPHPILRAQTGADTSQIVERLERLERQNAELTEEVHQLRAQLNALQAAAAPGAPAAGIPTAATEDALAIEQERVNEQAQSKVEAAHKLPLRITGMALFNTFYDTRADAGLYSGIVASTYGEAAAGGNLSQSIIGLEFQSPSTVFGAKVDGNLFVDFFGNATGATTASSYGQWPMPRLRTGVISMNWDSRSVTVGVDKPLVSPYAPDSFAQVAIAPLNGAGNLWFWGPQARFEQRISLSGDNVLRLQAALYATHETSNYVPSEYASTLAPTRPGWEGRFQFAHRSEEDAGFDIATGFHFSDTHVAGQTVTSDLFSLDGRLRLSRWWNLTGTLFTGENLTGIGGSGQGFSILPDKIVRPVRSQGGWLQLTLSPTDRLSLHFFGGEQNNRRSDLWGDAIGSNASYAGNVYYQLAPNVFAAFEAGRTQTDWTVSGSRLRNLYDLSLAYLF